MKSINEQRQGNKGKRRKKRIKITAYMKVTEKTKQWRL